MTELLEKIPPQALDAEQAVIGAFLLERDAITAARAIEFVPEHCYRETHRLIIRAIYDLYQRKEPVDLVTLARLLTDREQLEEIGGMLYLTTVMAQVPTAAGIRHYVGIVKREAYRRQLIKAADEIMEAAYTLDSDVDELRRECEKRIVHAGDVLSGQVQMRTMEDIAVKIGRAKARELETGEIAGMRTGFSMLDRYMLRGLQAGEMVVIAGRPSHGKTALALNMVEYLARQGNAGIFFSQEMSEDSLVGRAVKGQFSDNLLDAFDDAEMARQYQTDYLLELANATNAFNGLPVLVDDAPANLGQIESRILRAKEHWRSRGQELTWFVIDYLQMLRASNPRQSRYEIVTELVRGVKDLAKAHRITALVLSQLSRACEQRTPKRPIAADLRESGQFEQDADAILLVYRPAQYGPKEIKDAGMNPELHADYGEVIIAKQRGGAAPRTAFLRYDGPRTRFRDLDEREYVGLLRYLNGGTEQHALPHEDAYSAFV